MKTLLLLLLNDISYSCVNYHDKGEEFDPKTPKQSRAIVNKTIMKNNLFKLAIGALFCIILLPSCFTYVSVVGEGAQGSQEITKWNHYVVYGLAPVGVSDSKEMANGAENYEVKTEQTFVNGLVAALTFGIYTPTTTTVKK